jgi:hypothetical protein
MATPRRVLVEAAAVAVATAAVALAVNTLRPAGLPLVASAPYQTVVPCPEPGGPVRAIAPGDVAVRSKHSFPVDARSAAEYRDWHLERAVSVPYDWLEPLPEGTLEELARAIAASRATVVVVYGDGGRPDSGEHLGREISGRGIRNVCFVTGGAVALAREEAR